MNATQQTAAPPETSVVGLVDNVITPDMEEMLAQMEARKGDPSKMSVNERADYVKMICRALRLSPLTRPVQFMSLQGKEVAYLTRTATDQLAAMHKLNRKTIVAPHITDIAGTKVAMCTVEVTLPSGRAETATATLPVQDPVNLYMKLETKAKRRGTLSILGLGLLNEEEAESIPGAQMNSRPEAPTQPSTSAATAPLTSTPQQPQDAPTGDGAPDTHDLDSDAEEEGPSSRSWARYVDIIAGQPTLAAVHTAYQELVSGLNEEGVDVERFVGGAGGAYERARQRMELLRHRLVSTEVRQVLASRPLAELLDAQANIIPSDGALEKAARWWIDHRPSRLELEPAHRKTPWLPLVRRYSGATQAADVKRAGAALEGAVKLLDKPTPPTGSDAPKGTAGGAANGNGGGGESSGLNPGARAVVEQFRLHVHDVRRDGEDRGAGHVAGSFWKRADTFRALGIHAACLGVVLDELAARGVAEPSPWLQEIGERNGYTKRATRAA